MKVQSEAAPGDIVKDKKRLDAAHQHLGRSKKAHEMRLRHTEDLRRQLQDSEKMLSEAKVALGKAEAMVAEAAEAHKEHVQKVQASQRAQTAERGPGTGLVDPTAFLTEVNLRIDSMKAGKEAAIASIIMDPSAVPQAAQGAGLMWDQVLQHTLKILSEASVAAGAAPATPK
eukprot:4391272-Alexandrium_andersonii.AAC.1